MAEVTERINKGKMQISTIQGEYKGKPTFSYIVKKRTYNETTKQWEESEFLSEPDLRDLYFLIQLICLKTVKKQEVKPKPKPKPEPPQFTEEEVINIDNRPYGDEVPF